MMSELTRTENCRKKSIFFFHYENGKKSMTYGVHTKVYQMTRNKVGVFSKLLFRNH